MHLRRIVIAVVATGLCSRASWAQVSCKLGRVNDSTFAGICLSARDTFAELRLSPPLSTEKGLWRGVARDPNGRRTPAALDSSATPVFRTGFWLAATKLSIGPKEIVFEVNPAAAIIPSTEDLEILRRARSYFPDSSRWDHSPDPDVTVLGRALIQTPAVSRGGFCPRSERRTLFCALYDASIEITGEYWGGRPASNAIRAAVLAVPGDGVQHPLLQFNGAATTGFQDVVRVLDNAVGFIQEQRKCQVQYWIWGSPRADGCR